MTQKITRWVQRMDYRYLLPAMARLPFSIGVFASYCRGLLQVLVDYDWRSIALGRKYIRSNVYQAMTVLLGSRSKSIMGTLGRFLHNSRSEYQDCLYINEQKIEKICQNSKLNGIEDILKAQKEGRGVVLLSCHFDSFIMGMVLLGKKGINVNVLTSSLVEDKRIHPDVINFFTSKYRLMEKYIGGKMVHYETGLDFYYQALDRGESLVIMADVQGGKSDIYIPFLERNLRMPIGAWHMAKKTNSLIGAYMCIYVSPGVYQINFFPLREIDAESPVNTLLPIYAFLEGWIRKMPGRWLAAEHLMNYGL